MDYIMLAIMILISLIVAYILLWALGLIFVGIVVFGLGTFVAENITSALRDAEYGYAPYLYNKYKVFKMKKDLGVLYINEPFIWTDEQADEQTRLAFEYATTTHDVTQ